MQILQFPDSSWGLTVLKNIFLRFIGLKGLKWFGKKVPWFEIFFPDFGWKPLFFPDFPDWKKSSKFSLNSLISLIGGNPVYILCLSTVHTTQGQGMGLQAIGLHTPLSRCGDLNQPPIFRAPLDHCYCCEWDPIFINVDFLTNELI